MPPIKKPESTKKIGTPRKPKRMTGQFPQGLYCRAWKKKTSRKAKKRSPSRDRLWLASGTLPASDTALLPSIAFSRHLLPAVAGKCTHPAGPGRWTIRARSLAFPAARLDHGAVSNRQSP